MDMTNHAPPPAGHNRPPPYDTEAHADLAARTDKFMAACNDVRAAGEVSSEETAQMLSDLIAGLRGLKKQVEAQKKQDKAPHDEAGKAVLAAFTPLEERLERATKAMLALMQAWMDKKRAEAEAEKARKAAEAEAARKAAEEAAAKAAATGDLDAEIEAEKLAADAAKAEKQAAKDVKVSVGSATGAGRTISSRKVRTAEITNPRALFLRYVDHPKVLEVLQSLANADVRAGEITEANGAMFGVIVRETAVAA
jgi:23S rRNA pseudoU1915 N3-methylase RlmH